MNVYIDAIEARREIVRLYDSANRSKTAHDYANYQRLADIAVGTWSEKFGSLDRAELNRQTMLHH